MASTDGRMAEFMMVSGRIIKWKASEYLPGQMEGDTKGNTSTTRKREEALSSGPMEENMKETGRMENRMALAFTHRHQERQREENGTKERESLG